MHCFKVLIVVLIATGLTLGLQLPNGPSSKLAEKNKDVLRRKIERLHSKRIAALFKSANDLVDTMMEMVDETIKSKNLDPHEFAEGTFLGFHYNGWIGGYSSLTRLGDASMNKIGDTTYISTQLQMTNLVGNFSYWFKVLGIKVEGAAKANIDFVTMQLNLRFIKDIETQKITAFVDDFHIIAIGPILVHVSGLEPFDYLVNTVADVIVNLVKYLIPILVDGVIKEEIQHALDNMFS